MIRMLSSTRVWVLEKHEKEWEAILKRIDECRETAKGIPALEELLNYIEHGKQPKNRSFRDHFISLMEKFGWQWPTHLKD